MHPFSHSFRKAGSTSHGSNGSVVSIGRSSGGSMTIKWLLLFLFGFIVGIFILNFRQERFLAEGSILDESSLAILKYMEVNKKSFLIYVLKQRLGTVWLIVLLSSSVLGIAAVYMYTIWLGVSMGFLMSVLTVRFGMKGIALFLVSTFPHYLLYVPAAVLLIAWGYRLSVKLYFPKKDRFDNYGSKRQMFFRFFAQLCIIHGVVIIGCLLESYVNPDIITKFLKIF